MLEPYSKPLEVALTPPVAVISPFRVTPVLVGRVAAAVVTVGVVVTTKEETASVLLGPNPSVTTIVQSEYDPTESESKTIALSPAIALVVAESHEPPIEISPALLLLKV